MKTKVIALSAISAGLVALSLTIGAYVEFADVFALILASFFVNLPLCYNSYKGAFLCYLAGGLIAFICSGFNFMSIVFPSYFIYFGLFPLLFSFFNGKNLHKAVKIIIGIIWTVLFFIGLYYYYIFIMKMPVGAYPSWAEWFINNVYIVLVACGIGFFFLFDRFITVSKKLLNYYVKKIVK